MMSPKTFDLHSSVAPSQLVHTCTSAAASEGCRVQPPLTAPELAAAASGVPSQEEALQHLAPPPPASSCLLLLQAPVRAEAELCHLITEEQVRASPECENTGLSCVATLTRPPPIRPLGAWPGQRFGLRSRLGRPKRPVSPSAPKTGHLT